jgi:hypothetical protein
MRNVVTVALALAIGAAPVLAATPAKHAVKPAAKPAAAPAKAAPKPSEEARVPLPETPELQQVRAAFQFAFPVYEMMRTRYNAVSRAQATGGAGVNHLYPRLTLADASSRDVTTPNNDTLYSSAWLDLSGGPVTFTLPALPQRYHSAALMDLFTDNTAILGTRMNGIGGNVLLVGPDWKGTAPDGIPVVRSLTNDAWLLVRVLVNGPDDLIDAADATKEFTLAPDPANTRPAPVKMVPTPVPDAQTLLGVVNEALGRGPLPAGDAARMAKFADAGIVPGDTGAFAKLPAETQALWTQALPQLRAELRGGLSTGQLVNGWSFSPANSGLYGDDDTARAKVALGGLAALPRQEAVYLTARVDKDNAPLTGANAYYIRMPAKMPVGAFWSLALYSQEKDGRLFFNNTPTKRYAITNRTKYLHFDRDGSAELFLQTGKPYGERAVNWLPLPAGPFVLVFRAYLPRGPLQDGSFAMPGLAKVDPIPTVASKDD